MTHESDFGSGIQPDEELLSRVFGSRDELSKANRDYLNLLSMYSGPDSYGAIAEAPEDD
jgi:hypothetical protein